MSKYKTLKIISLSVCPTVHVNKYLSCFTYGRVTIKGRKYVRTRK